MRIAQVYPKFQSRVRPQVSAGQPLIIPPANGFHAMLSNSKHTWLDHQPLAFWPSLSLEKLLLIILLALAVFTRFYNVDLRVMSHDEINHVIPSFDLYEGRGYRHDPVTHGPLQFHMIALSYFLLGDSDFSSRVPAALFSIATVMFVAIAFRRYLGRVGALVGGLLFLISPYILFYGRYTRNDAFVALYAVVLIYAVLRWLETGQPKYLLLATVATGLHYITKETSYIYSAELLIFLGLLLIDRYTRRTWRRPDFRALFLVLLIAAAALLIGVGLFLQFSKLPPAAPPEVTNGATATATAAATPGLLSTYNATAQIAIPVLGGLALLAALAALVVLFRGLGWAEMRKDRALDLLILQFIIILPLLSALPVRLAGFDPLDTSTRGIIISSIGVALMALLAFGAGLLWNPRLWLLNAAVFYIPFVVFFTTFFTNFEGLATGIMGSLGYWMVQQDVVRGGQPLYYYALIQLPMYEYLPLLGTLLAAAIGVSRALRPLEPRRDDIARQIELPFTESTVESGEFPQIEAAQVEVFPLEDPALPNGEPSSNLAVIELEDLPTGAVSYPLVLDSSEQPESDFWDERPLPSEDGWLPKPAPVLALLLFWSVSSLLVFTIAGERMPWLTVHITTPLLLASGWALGQVADNLLASGLRGRRLGAALPLLGVFLLSLAALLVSLFGRTPPFAGREVEQLNATGRFLLDGLLVAGSLGALAWLARRWQQHIARPAWSLVNLGLLALFALLGVLTIRTAIRANYINYDTALEYLVYAHAARGPKDALQQVEELSYRITGGKNLKVAYDSDGLYPFWWYLRDYPNRNFYGANVSRELRNSDVIFVSEANYAKMLPVVGDDYYEFPVMRLWWPNQDYFYLNSQRLRGALTDRELRSAIFDIWFRADYAPYAQWKIAHNEMQADNNTLTLENWQPSSRMKMYIRKDIVASMWPYGAAPAAAVADPYEAGRVQLNPDTVIGGPGQGEGQFQAPRGIAFAPDGSVYVADSRNNRIQHLLPDGTPLHLWGSYANLSEGEAPGGTFYEPWGVAVSPDGQFVYVTDTWNNRVQKFTADGQFVTMWGSFGQAETPAAFWGPRGIAVDAAGRVFVMDTGNKRVAVFDPDGNFLTQFGTTGMEMGQFDEPVGIAFDANGRAFITDTWNQRVQVFAPDAAGLVFTPVNSWEISGWYGESLENKPFIAAGPNGSIYVTDPEAGRVLEFTGDGQFVRTWGEATGDDTLISINIASGIAVDPQGRVWVTDSGNNALLRYVLP